MSRYFEGLENEWVEMLTKMISERPYSEHEKGVADILVAELESIGAEHYRDEAGNVIGVIRGQEDGPVIMTNGHMDVVPEGSPEAWGGHDPFAPDVTDGKLYGRGTTDMLSGLLSQYFAFREVKKAVDNGAVLKGTLIFTGVVCEETAESMGVLHLCETTLPELGFKPDFCILGEQTAGNVTIGQRGKVELVVDVFGKVAHSSAPWQGISAVEKAMPVIEAINSNMYKESMHHEKLGPSVMCVTDIEVTPGRMYSCVPDKCSITVDRRYVPPVTVEDTIEEIRNFLDFLASKDPDFKAEVHRRMNLRTSYTGYAKEVAKQHPGWVTDINNPFVQQAFESLRAVGQDPKESYFVGGTDGSVTCGLYNIPTISYAMTLPAMCHQPGEYCVIADEIKEVEGNTRMLFDMLGLDFDAAFNA